MNKNITAASHLLMFTVFLYNVKGGYYYKPGYADKARRRGRTKVPS
jgi:hypothetical protein